MWHFITAVYQNYPTVRYLVGFVVGYGVIELIQHALGVRYTITVTVSRT